MIGTIDDRSQAREPRAPDPYYILAAAPSADEQSRVLKHGDTFGVFDHYGDIKPVGLHEQGLYFEGTRFLSCFLLGLGPNRPLFLSSTIKEDNDLLVADLTNPDIPGTGEVTVPRGTLHILRTKFLWKGVCYERLRIKNYGLSPVEVTFGLHFEADFVDIFEVRGMRRARRGELLGATIEEGRISDGRAVLAYRGLDRVVRRTRLVFAPRPEMLTGSEARFRLSLQPTQEENVDVTVACEIDRDTALLSFDEALAAADSALKSAQPKVCMIESSKQHFNDWINRTVADLHMMITDTPAGPYPYAGVPWFSTAFGRDGVITALQTLWLARELGKGVLAFLAATQATRVDAAMDAEPGKILHETRKGEMAALGEVPFGRYYGSVDSTPLFVVLAAAYYKRTGDIDFIRAIWPNIGAALGWMRDYADPDGDGFLEYDRRSDKGLTNQGWKASNDSVFHANGRLAEPPIALVEVQGYAYAAWRGAPALARALGEDETKDDFTERAATLQQRFEEAFWCPEIGTYALALDGAKRPCRVRSSNAGHALFAGIANPAHAARVAATLMDDTGFSDWGIRTVAAGEARYNPMSYHNGSVWPHDNGLIAMGFSRYGLREPLLRVMGGLFAAAAATDLDPLPQPFCGFPRPRRSLAASVSPTVT